MKSGAGYCFEQPIDKQRTIMQGWWEVEIGVIGGGENSKHGGGEGRGSVEEVGGDR